MVAFWPCACVYEIDSAVGDVRSFYTLEPLAPPFLLPPPGPLFFPPLPFLPELLFLLELLCFDLFELPFLEPLEPFEGRLVPEPIMRRVWGFQEPSFVLGG